MLDLEAGDEAGAADRQGVAQVVAPPHAQRQRVEPAVAEGDAEAVAPLGQLAGDVVHGVEDALVGAGPEGVQVGVPDDRAVERRLAVAEAAEVEPRAPDRAGHGELPAEQRRRVVLIEPRLGLRERPPVADPAGPPVRLPEQPHLPPRGCAPRGRRVVPVPCHHLPEAALAAGRRRAGVGDLDAAGGTGLAGVPQQVPSGGQVLRGRGDHDPIGGLGLAAGRRLQRPAEARGRVVDPQRLLAPLAAQAGDVELGRGGGPGGGRDRRHRQPRGTGEDGSRFHDGGEPSTRAAPPGIKNRGRHRFRSLCA